MFAVGIPELAALLLLLLACGVGLALALGLRRGERVPATRESRLVGLTRATGAALGLVLAWRVAGSGSYGTGPMLAAASFGCCLLLAVVLGETVVRPRRRGGQVRAASLTTRRVSDYLPRRLGTAAGVQVVALLALLGLTTSTGSVDPTTQVSRALTCAYGQVTAIRTPYPGSFYSRPLLLALVVVLVIAGLALVQVVRRPRGSGPVDGDDALRRRSARVVVAATGIAVAGPYCGVAAVTASALLSLGGGSARCAPGWMHPTGVLVALSVAPSVVFLLSCLAVLLLGRARTGSPAPTTGPPAPHPEPAGAPTRAPGHR